MISDGAPFTHCHRGGHGEVLNATVISVRISKIVLPGDGKLDLEAIGVISREAQNPPTRALFCSWYILFILIILQSCVYNADYVKVSMLIQWECYEVIVIRPPL